MLNNIHGQPSYIADAAWEGCVSCSAVPLSVAARNPGAAEHLFRAPRGRALAANGGSRSLSRRPLTAVVGRRRCPASARGAFCFEVIA